jgi:ribosomal RNA-processing protein 12
MHLKSVVECLFQWQDEAKNHFKAKVSVFVILCDFIDLLRMAVVLESNLFIHIFNKRHSNYFQVKLLLGMLITKCGLEAVKAVLPEEHMKLLTNIRKVS